MDNPNALVALPLPTLPKPWRQAQAIGALATGMSQREAAAATGVPKSSVGDIAQAFSEHIEAEKRKVQENVLGHLRAVVPARAKAASDPENRTGPQSAYWLTDLLGWTGKAGGVSVHVGDTYNQTLIVPPAEGLSGEAAERLAKARSQFGI